MPEAQPILPGRREEADAARVVRVLRLAGPLTLTGLARHPALSGWPRDRLENAVVSAWASTQIFVDTRDLLVAI
jgi:hypothetical protein